MNSWFFFAITAPLLWAAAIVIDSATRKHFVKDDRALTWAVSALRLPLVVVFFIIGGFEIPSTIALLMMIIGGLFWTWPLILYLRAMKTEEPSRVSLFMQMTPIFAFIIAYFALQERLNFDQGIGFIFLFLGGLLASFKYIKKKWHFSSAIILIAISSFFWASSDVIFKKYEVVFSTFWSAFAMYFLGSFLVAIFMITKSKERKRMFSHLENLPRKAWSMITASIILGLMGTLSFSYALTLGKASLTAVVMGTEPIFAFLIGWGFSLFIKEVEAERIKGSSIILKGVSLVLIFIGLFFLNF